MNKSTYARAKDDSKRSKKSPCEEQVDQRVLELYDDGYKGKQRMTRK